MKTIFKLIAGIVLSLFGSFLVSAYVIEAWIKRISEADQSLLYWYLPFLFVGIILLVPGITLSIVSYKQLKQ
jgi:hypothetical protein